LLRKKAEVIDYVVEKYGKDRVAQIITFGTMAARAVIRDVGRALDIPYGEVDAIAKMIPFQIGMSIEKAMELNPELRQRYNDDERVKELIDTAKLLEACRDMLPPMPREWLFPGTSDGICSLQRSEDSITTQFPMGILEELGLLKMDFLGLRTLTVIRDAVALIKKNHNIDVKIDELQMDDPNVFKLIGEDGRRSVPIGKCGYDPVHEGASAGVSGRYNSRHILYRPGPMDQIPRYLRNKNNPELVKYDHPLLENILNVTYGCMVYQEQ